jgi:CreA protein
MLKSILLAAMLLSTPAIAEEIGHVDTTFRLMGSNDRIVIEAYDDPGIPGVTCHVSRAVKGGVMADIGLGSNPNEASIACRQVGPIDWEKAQKLPQTEPEIFTQKTSLLFKELKVGRIIDKQRKVLVYLVYTTKGWDGSPKNVISSIPVMPWQQ